MQEASRPSGILGTKVDAPIAAVVEAAGKAAGTKIVLADYVRFQLGEGIEKEVSDFAAEVAAASGVPQPTA